MILKSVLRGVVQDVFDEHDIDDMDLREELLARFVSATDIYDDDDDEDSD